MSRGQYEYLFLSEMRKRGFRASADLEEEGDDMSFSKVADDS